MLKTLNVTLTVDADCDDDKRLAEAVSAIVGQEHDVEFDDHSTGGRCRVAFEICAFECNGLTVSGGVPA